LIWFPLKEGIEKERGQEGIESSKKSRKMVSKGKERKWRGRKKKETEKEDEGTQRGEIGREKI